MTARLLNVTKRYGKTVALDDLSLDIRPSELLRGRDKAEIVD